MSDLMLMERREIESEVHPLVAAAKALVVVDEATYTQAMELGKMCAAKIKWIEGKLERGKKAAYDSWQEWVKLEKEGVGPLQLAKDMLATRGYSWRKAEEDRKRKEAEEARREAEAEAAEKRRIEEENRLALAQRLEKDGMNEQAAEVLDAPINVKVAEVAAPAPAAKVGGTSPQEIWKGEVVDASLIPRDYLTPDLVKLNQATKMLKGETRIPGWRAFDAGRMKFRS